MAFVTLNGFDVEHASSLLVYENLFPEIQHLDGKGVTERYTNRRDIENVTYIDVTRVLPYAPNFRQLGATNNGAFHNQLNIGGYGNAPQSNHYSIPVNLIYDRGVQMTLTQIESTQVEFKQMIIGQLVKTAGMAINIITYAKQLEAFFRNGDNFDKEKAHNKGEIVADDIAEDEIASSVFFYDSTAVVTSTNYASNAFLNANASLNDGIPEIGAFIIPSDARQAFITPQFDRLMKMQYQQNASEASARILATGFINPFTNSEGTRINQATGLCGMYDGVDMVQFNKVTKDFVYKALGIEENKDAKDLLDKIGAIIVYGAGTCRGVVGPSIEANPNYNHGGVYILPRMKVGVEVLHGATIKLVVNAGANLADAWTSDNIATLMNTLTFTPIDGVAVTGTMKGFNTGTTN